MTDISTHITETGSGNAELGDYYALLKPRVMQLVVFTALAGMVAAPTGLHPVVALASLICIAVGAGASGALNMWWDADIDRQMSRTQTRPIPSGSVARGEALGLGLGLSVLSVMMLGVFANPLAGGLLAFTIFFYVVIYSMWLKRSTPQNIVIGGAAGAFPPMVGWAAMTGEISTASVLMFAVIFLWTPPHFWALALFRNDDYARVGVPMMPVVAGPKATRRQIWLYTLILVPAPLALAFTEAGGPVTLLTALYANYLMLRWAWAVKAERLADFRAEKKLFGVSIIYLFAIFGAIIADAAIRLVTGPYWLAVL
ncbi:heme o synthase [Rhodobacteraceae bacterium NNCM2]|nr:heme o synthase [Coraliihabitans acroporae]